jgi:hypothetical protein
MPSLRTAFILVLVAATGVVGCRSRLNRSETSTEGSAKSVASASARPDPSNAAKVRNALASRRDFRPVGIPHAVEPGMGLGPIMFGATVATIERHMRMKCEELTETRCRIITAGVEFELTNGVVSGIQIHRFDRPVEGSDSKLWGVFAGGIPPNVLMTMVPEAVIESLGEPKTSVEVKEQNPYNTVRRDTYDGLILDYDLNPANKRLMLGGIRIVKKG